MSPEHVGDDPGAREPAAAHCPICARPREEESALVLRDLLFGVPGDWPFSRCPDCAHVWLSPRPSQGDLGQSYRAYYTHTPDRPAVGWGPALSAAVHRWVLAGAFGYDTATRAGRALGWLLSGSRLLRDIAGSDVLWNPAPTEGARLVDIGCGDGVFLERMRSLGWQVCGIETDPEAVRVARGRGLDVRQGEIEALTESVAPADVVTLHHVIEHVMDPESALRAAAKLLRPGGRLILATPNTRGLLCSRFGRHWRGWEPPRHLHVFHPANLATVAERAGLLDVEVRTSARSADYFFVSSEMIRENELTGRIGLRDPSATQLLRALAWRCLEAAACWFGGEGEEIVLVARRP